jgi:nicotinamide-nucleotide amidase
MLESSIAEIADPARSWLARRAEHAGERLRAGPESLRVSTLELAHARAVRTAEAVAELRAGAPGGVARLNLYAGADLVRRMANPSIFSDPDLRFLSESCRYWALDRDGDSARAELAALQAARGVRLEARTFPAAEMPDWLAGFLPVASTLIRHAAEAGDPLEGMVTRSAAETIRGQGLYRAAPPPYHIVDADGRSHGTRTALRLLWESLREDLSEAARPLAERLAARRRAGLPGALALLETSCGGNLTWAFAARSGASRFFPQSRFAYDRRAKAALIGESAAGGSSVSPEMAGALAQAMRREAGADYALAESGMAGPPDGERHSLKQGECWVALATPEDVLTEPVRLNPFLTRQEHQLRFAIHALRWAAGLIPPPPPMGRGDYSQ